MDSRSGGIGNMENMGILNLGFERPTNVHRVYSISMINSFPASHSSFKKVAIPNGRLQSLWSLRKQDDISGCETKTPHLWGADTSYHFHILWSWLVSSKHIPWSARGPWRQSPHTKILLGCLTAADQNQLLITALKNSLNYRDTVE